MNSIALIFCSLTAFGQIRAGESPSGLKAGWKTEADGYVSYIAQVPPDIAAKMATEGREMALDIPDFLQGRVNRVVWRIGVEDVEREPSEAELRSMPREVFPRSGANSVGPGLSNLGGNAIGNGGPVMIDSPRPGAMMLSAAGASRLADSDPTLPPVPSLAQNYPSSTRASQTSQFDMPRSGLGSGAGGNLATPGPSLGINPVLPRQDTLPPSNSKPLFGPQLPPTSTYTGGQVTVTGAPTGAGTQNSWNDTRTGATSGQYGTNNPIANGNFGNPNNYLPSNAGSGLSGPANSYSANNPQGYPATTTGLNGGTGYPGSNSQYQYNAANPSSYTNGASRPDAYLASSNNYPATPYAANPYSGTSSPSPYPYPLAPQTAPGWNNGTYPPAGANAAGNYPGMSPNPGMMPPTQYMASLPQAPPLNTRTVVDGTRRTTSSRDDIPYENVPATPPSYVVALLVASLVGNFYLVMLLNTLLQRYRNLQASSRGTTSLAI